MENIIKAWSKVVVLGMVSIIGVEICLLWKINEYDQTTWLYQVI